MPSNDFNIIVTVDSNMGIGNSVGVPWSVRDGKQRIKHLTKYGLTSASEQAKAADKELRNGAKRTVIVGGNTYGILGGKHFYGRHTVVVTSDMNRDLGDSLRACCLEEALDIAYELGSFENFVIGGETLFSEAMTAYMRPRLKNIYASHISGNYRCENAFPKNWTSGEGFVQVGLQEKSVTEDGIIVTHQTWENTNYAK